MWVFRIEPSMLGDPCISSIQCWAVPVSCRPCAQATVVVGTVTVAIGWSYFFPWVCQPLLPTRWSAAPRPPRQDSPATLPSQSGISDFFERWKREIQGIECKSIFSQDHSFDVVRNYSKTLGPKCVSGANVCVKSGEIASCVLLATKQSQIVHVQEEGWSPSSPPQVLSLLD